MEYKCAYSNTLVSTQFACVLATAVVRRGGPEVACAAATAHARCGDLFQRMKQAALPAFGVEDDLLSMPHSVVVKIQHGGLLGLQRVMDNAPAVGQTVANINDLIERAQHRYGDYAAIPYSELVQDMTAYKLKRRGAG